MIETDVVAAAQTHLGWPRDRAEAAVSQLMATGKWGLEQLYLGFRANFYCEYCGRDLLESADNYKLWEKDHLVPGLGDGLDNLALACLPCNCKFKNRWWRPSGQVAPGDRDSLIAEVKDYVQRRREEAEREVAGLRATLR